MMPMQNGLPRDVPCTCACRCIGIGTTLRAAGVQQVAMVLSEALAAGLSDLRPLSLAQRCLLVASRVDARARDPAGSRALSLASAQLSFCCTETRAHAGTVLTRGHVAPACALSVPHCLSTAPSLFASPSAMPEGLPQGNMQAVLKSVARMAAQHTAHPR